MRGATGGPSSAIMGGMAQGALVAGLMILTAGLALGWIQAGTWGSAASGACLFGALALSVAFSFEMKADGGVLFLLALPLFLLATVLSLCLMPDMVLAWIS